MNCIHFARVYKDPTASTGPWICLNCGTKGEGPHEPLTYAEVDAALNPPSDLDKPLEAGQTWVPSTPGLKARTITEVRAQRWGRAIRYTVLLKNGREEPNACDVATFRDWCRRNKARLQP